jgi:hypothetical protein
MRKIAVLYVCTGRYEKFFDAFYESSKKHFFRNHSVTYYVWTDSDREIFRKPDVVLCKQKRIGWPYDTLLRFHLFYLKRNELSKFDYLFFFNANSVLVMDVAEDILPSHRENDLVSVRHSAFLESRGTFETNPDSTAFVSPHIDIPYLQGSLSGGTSKAYLEMCRVCSSNIDEDLKRNIVAVWWDESHMNRYFMDHPPKALDPGYSYPEMLDFPYTKRILQLEKNNHGGHGYLRFATENS